jgi:transposase-like protein
MKKKKVYSKDFKLQVVQEYLNSEKSLKDFSNEYSLPKSIISDYSKISRII